MISPGMLLSERYEIIDRVGSGGMADVYKARDQRLNRFVAIKILKPEYSNDAKFVSKFRGEAQSVAGLSHPNVVNVYDVGEDDDLYYIVMELVEGITLKRFIEKKGRLDVKEAIGIGVQIAQGMQAAHDNSIIHRDIKPQNIIISKEGKVKVTDFGIAKAATSNTITSNAMGSVHYISPEQARGGYSDEKSDIYSLGVTMYELDPCLQCNKCRLSSIQFAHFAKHLDLFSIKGSRLHTPAPIGSYCGRFIHSCRIVQFQNILHLEYNSIRNACVRCTQHRLWNL